MKTQSKKAARLAIVEQMERRQLMSAVLPVIHTAALATGTSTIKGTVFNDANKNRAFDSGEKGLPAWSVYIDLANTGKYTSADPTVPTNASGQYTFSNLAAGTFIVRTIAMTNWSQTTPTNNLGIHVTVAKDKTASGNNFGFLQAPVVVNNATINGTVFNDANNNGELNTGEAGLGGWSVYIDLSNTGTYASADPIATTNSSGQFSFTGLAAGTFIVRPLAAAGWQQTLPAHGYGLHVTVAKNGVANGNNFGFFQPVVVGGSSISGTLFNDANQNGTFDTGEVGLNGWTVYIDVSNTGVYASTDPHTATDAAGQYAFTGLSANTYVVRILAAGGWQQTLPGNSASQTITVGSSDMKAGVNFGYFQSVVATSGLSALFYANSDFTGASVMRDDPTVDFDWAGTSPAAGIGATNFSARWTGMITAPATETYTFAVQGSDGIRLWVNNQIIINDWSTHATPVTDTGTFALTAGQPTSIRLEYFDGSDPASVHLSWSSTSVPQEIIPAANLTPTVDPLLAQIDSAMGFAAQQLNTTLTAMKGNTTTFPFYTNPNGTWVTSNVGNWTAGFFGAQMWQMFNRTNNATWKQNATTWTLPLAADTSFTDDLTFRIFNAYYPLYEATGNAAYKQVILNAVASKVSTWNATVGGFSSVGVASHSGNPNANFGMLMDHMMDYSMVLWAAKLTGNQTWYDESLQQARTLAANFFRPNGSVYQWGYFDKSTGQFISGENYQGYSDSSAWARAQSWAIYAFSMFYRETGAPDMLADAERVANYFIANLPADQVPYWDFNSPAIPNTFRDTSAAAVAASGLLMLGKIDPDSAAGSYYNEGKAILSSLISPAYLAKGSSSEGILLHGAWFVPAPENNGDASLVWGDYYVLEAMNEYVGMPSALPGT